MKRMSLVLSLLLGSMPPGIAAPVWEAGNTRLVVVSLAGFSGEKPGHTSFSTSDRLDDPLVELFRKRGVPDAQILYLKDDHATKAAVEARFPAFLSKSVATETLVFYYSSHGGYDPKTGGHTFTTFDGSIPIGWFVGNIEKLFVGARALYFSDCCFSGGLVDLAEVRPKGHTAVGALSTTGSHNLGYSGWRFTDLLMRAWSGDRAMDRDDSGSIDFGELCDFAEHYMAFVAEGKPLSTTNGPFPKNLVLSKTTLPAKAGVGMLVEARDGGEWYKGEVVDAQPNPGSKGDRLQIHFTDKSRYARVLWVPETDVRSYRYPNYAVGTQVEIRDAKGAWLPGKVLAAFENMHECQYDGKSAFYDEWMSPSRIRKVPR
jgi:hypothetical protein